MSEHPQKSRTFPRFRLVWSSKSTPKVNWWRGLVGLQTRGGKDRGFVLHVAFKGMLLWSGSLAMICFVVATAVGAYVLNRNPYNRISYADLVLPTRWDELRVKRGQTLIDEGLNELKAQRYAAGIMMVNHGLKLEPSNIPARMIMGQLFAQSGMMQRSDKLFRQGIPYAGGQRRYLDITFRLTEYLEDFEQVLAMVDEAMPTLSADDRSTRRWLGDKRADALVKLGRFDEVLSLWEKFPHEQSMALNSARARALAGLGRGKEAINAVKKDPNDYGVFAEPWSLLVELALEVGDVPTGTWAADKLVEVDPGDFQLHVQRLVYLAHNGYNDQVGSAVMDFFLRFGLNGNARVTLLKRLEPVATSKMVQSVWAQIESLGIASVPERIAYVQDLISAGDLPEAAKEFEKTSKVIGATNYADGGWMDGTRNLLDLLMTGSASARSQLQAFCNDHPLSPEAFRMLVRVLERDDRLLAARDIVTLVRNRYPSIQGLPDITMPEQMEEAAMASDQKKKVNDATRIFNPEAREELVALEEDMGKGNWLSAVERIAKVEKSPLAKEMSEKLLYDRVMIHGQLSNQMELSWYLRRVLDLKQFDPSRLRALAETLHAAGRSDSALTLLSEIVRKHQEASWAFTMRQSIQESLKAAPIGLTDPK